MKHDVLTACVFVLGSWSLAADWPCWRGPEGTGHVPAGVAVPKTLPGEVEVVWRMKIADGLGSPVVCGGKVFYLDHQQGKETVHAVEAASGRQLWSVPLDDIFRDAQSVPGPRCTHTADGERLYVQSCRGEFQCLSADDGRTIWRVNFVKDFGAVFIGERGSATGASRHGNTGSAVVDGDRILVGVGGRKGASVVCFNKRDGRVIWKSQDDVPGHSGPVIAAIAGVKQVISFTSEAVIGLDAGDGRGLWRVPVRTSLGRHVTTPVVVDDMVMVASYQAGLIGIRVSRQGDAFRAERAWAAKRWAINFSSPVAVGTYLYGLGPGKTLFCVDVRTGETAWANGGFFSGGKGYASFLVMNENLLVLAEDGQLSLVAADPKQCRTIATTRVCGRNWCNPAYVDGKLFLRDERELRCVKLMP
jgi:outer membrane protein assembly factor BamB